MLLSALIAASTLAACDRPTVVNVPATPVAVAGPAGPAGSQGMAGGSKGDPGKPGEGSTIIVVPPAASAPAN